MDSSLLLLGALAAQGLVDVADIQVRAALAGGELDAEQLREIGLFLTHYVGWPLGTKLTMRIEKILGEQPPAETNQGSG